MFAMSYLLRWGWKIWGKENYAPLPLLYAKDYSMILRGHKKENEDLIYVQARIRYLSKKYNKKNYSVIYLVW